MAYLRGERMDLLVSGEIAQTCKGGIAQVAFEWPILVVAYGRR